MNHPPLVIAHAGCPDGTCAAWVVCRNWPDADVHWAEHGSSAPNVAARDVVMVDFTYPAPLMKRIARECRSLVVLDHHVTAHENLMGIKGMLNHVVIELDDCRSGAGLAHDRLGSSWKTPRPWIVDYVEDRDLWRLRLPHTREINAALTTLPLDDWRAWARFYDEHPTPDSVVEHGRWILRAGHAFVRKTAEQAVFRDLWGYENVPVACAPTAWISELLHHLAAEHADGLAVGWRQTSSGDFSYSLRSTEDGPDVAEIASRYGGGGHVHAAGFRANRLVHEWVEQRLEDL